MDRRVFLQKGSGHLHNWQEILDEIELTIFYAKI